MDEKTEQLRDIFMNVTDDDTVTETQEEARGSLTADEGAVEEKLADAIERMRERFEFETELDDEALRTVVRGFYEGHDDTAIADRLGVDRAAVVDARHDLHLLRDRELEPPFELSALRELLDGEHTVAAVAEQLGVSPSTVRKYRTVVAVRDEIRRVNGRFTDEFAELLTDADLEEGLTDDVKEDGLNEATEGMETNVSF
jgi:predicted transcriptional regulator